ncbi:hypothetical protein STSP2_03153 [Anaerohalosphaera lusitana]|uniref:Uncharacterized protein n=1 Tax=Anaerohalosphaera lusitana TaxID=1936003 RepID=A0A1U9NPV2_9BACT|nr:hypothetical protein [Anaerohalosphaera lusitana]AQT69953.1 hypothetical protein STSP2_03153 [Anaerohalosphaera lusitana]
MAVSYQAIIDKIDQAILDGVDGPVKFSLSGRSFEYNSLDELLNARAKYARLNAGKKRPGGVRIAKTVVGGY